MTAGGKFAMGSAKWFGKTAVKDIASFYKSQMPGKGWTEGAAVEDESSVFLQYSNAKDESLILVVQIDKVDAGTEVAMVLTKEASNQSARLSGRTPYAVAHSSKSVTIER